MTAHAPVSVLLPTVEHGEAVGDVAAQLREPDELLVICDAPSDPVAERRAELPAAAEVVVAGEPVGCSGKANAIAAGMEAASHERLVWTDDDFHHPPDWLETLREDYDRHGPVTELPVFVGRDPLARLLEPTNVLFGTLGVLAADKAWGGAVIFERGDLESGDRADGEAAFLRDLRRTISDDGLLSERLDLTAQRRTRRVPAGGSIRASLERHVRFTQIAYRHEPVGMAIAVVGSVLSAMLCLFLPLIAAPTVTATTGAVYRYLGVRRWTWLLAFPATVLGPILAAYALGRRTFRWGGRRYRWRSKFEVEVLDGER